MSPWKSIPDFAFRENELLPHLHRNMEGQARKPGLERLLKTEIHGVARMDVRREGG